MITTNFSRYLVTDSNNRVIRAPDGFELDYVDEDLEIVCFRSADTFTQNFTNPVTLEKYSVQTPRAYRVEKKNVQLIRA